MKQANRQWYEKLSHVLISSGYVQSQADHSLFIKAISTVPFTAILIYVDDMVLMGNDPAEIARVKQQLDALFKIKDLGSLKFFLGLEIARTSRGNFVCQQKYILELIAFAGLLGCKPAISPMAHTIKLVKDDGKPLADASAYQRLVGQLLYLTNTRPDIYYNVSHLSQFLSNPMEIHYQAALHVLRYLKGSPSHGLFFPVNSKL